MLFIWGWDKPSALCHPGCTRERSGSLVECLTRDRRVASLSLTGVTALYTHYKKKRKLLNLFLELKLLIFKMILFQWLCPSIKTFTTEFRQRNDFEFNFRVENLKS